MSVQPSLYETSLYPLGQFKTCGSKLSKRIKLGCYAAFLARAAYDQPFFAAHAYELQPSETARVPSQVVEEALADIGSSRIMSNHLKRLYPPVLAAVVHMLKSSHFRQALHGIILRLTDNGTRSLFPSFAGLNLPMVVNYSKEPEAILTLRALFHTKTLKEYIAAFRDDNRRNLLPTLVEAVTDSQIEAFKQLLPGFEPWRFELADWHGDHRTIYNTPPQIALICNKSVAVIAAMALHAPRAALAPLVRSSIYRHRLDVLNYLVYELGFLIPQESDTQVYNVWHSTPFIMELIKMGMHGVQSQLHTLCLVGKRLCSQQQQNPIGHVLCDPWLQRELASVFVETLIPIKKPKEQDSVDDWLDGEDALDNSLMRAIHDQV